MEEQSQSKATIRIWLGFCLVLVGLAFLLERFGLMHAEEVLRFWPSALLLVLLLRFTRKKSHAPDVLWLAVLLLGGLLLQLHVLGLVHVHLRLVWPVVLILIGLRIFRSSFRTRPSPKQESHAQESGPESQVDGPRGTESTTESIEDVVIFGGRKRRVLSAQFQGGSVEAIFGGYVLDLRQADFPGTSVQLRVSSIFGGVEVWVPDHWQVVTEGSSLLGGFEDHTHPLRPSPEAPEKKLIVKGVALLGGVEIKN